MRRSRERDDDDFVEFATAITPRLFRSALMLCGDWHLAEDLVQITLAKLYVSWNRVRSADAPEAYARGALTKEFLSHKRLKRSREVPTAETSEPGVPHQDDGETRLELLGALRELDPTDRAIVVLRYWEDRSVAATAAALNLSEGAVRARASRAMPRLRAVLTPEATR